MKLAHPIEIAGAAALVIAALTCPAAAQMARTEPGQHHHGMMAGGGHAGDMPNLHVPGNGELTVELLNASIALGRGKPNSVIQPDGTSLVIHAKADDYKSDPAGNSGDRIACGVIGDGSGTVGSRPPQR